MRPLATWDFIATVIRAKLLLPRQVSGPIGDIMLWRHLSLPAALFPLLTIHATATTRIWTNTVGIANWSNAANWVNGVPVDGDSVVLLRHPLGQFVNAINDLPNLTLQSIRCEALGYNLSGDSLRLIDEVLMGGPAAGATMNISAPVEILGSTFHVVSTNGSELSLSGLVTAPVGTVVTVDGGIRFKASPASDYRAETRLRSGFLPLLFTRLSGPVTVGGDPTHFASVVLQSGNVFGNFPPLTILTNGQVFNISTSNSVGPLTIDGGVLRLGNRSPLGDIVVNGNALLTGGASLFVTAINNFGPGSLSVTGSVTIAGCSLTFQPGSSAITRPAVIVRNDAQDPVIGTFTDLPEGSILPNGDALYTLSYVGGDGNDITLSPIIPALRFISVTQAQGMTQFTVQGQPGFLYTIEATIDLLSPPALTSWSPIHTTGTLPNGQFSFTDPDSTSFSKRFYRAVKP